jgi:phosphoglycolate phosphatase-like HAD superfamily hydrolase
MPALLALIFDVDELFLALTGDGVRLAVASSAREDGLEPLLDIAGVKDLVEQKTSSSDVESSKPDPDVVRAAIRSPEGRARDDLAGWRYALRSGSGPAAMLAARAWQAWR